MSPNLPASRRVRLILGVLAAVLALGAAYVAGYVTPQLAAPGDDSPEAGFARDMAIHHSQAVEMGMLAFQRSPTHEIQIRGYDIATSQSTQIGRMRQWLDDWHLTPATDQPRMGWMSGGTEQLTPDGLMPGMASDDELGRLRTASGKDFDILFCQLMVRHHLGGVHMAQEMLKLSDNPDVLALARSIETGQQREINILNNLLKAAQA